MPPSVPVPEPLLPAARAALEGRCPAPPAVPRDAATVVLLRDGGRGVEVYLLHRRTTMAFAAGMTVFPGGGVDARDADASPAWAGPAVGEWAERLNCDEQLARALVCAAVRETFEESGVLLAGPDADSVVADTTGSDWESARLSLLDRSRSLAETLQERHLALRSDLLAAWARWVTPTFEPRRYDTRFFVATLPTGQRARHVSEEAVAAYWLPVRDVVPGVERGAVDMLPPTLETCRSLVELHSAGNAIAAASGRDLRPIEPQLLADGELTRLVWRDD